ncbi:MAG: helix-turn-helix domain-containing protein, partial [Spirochaetia bacterium]|nr:helix-turn-helix domain-containing protein [Spirochaetia bacterium]
GLTKQKEPTVSEYAKKWLSFIQTNRAPSYYASVRTIINEVCESIGGYKLKELSPAIIQKYVNSLRNKTIVNVVGQGIGFKEEMKKQGFSQEKLAKISGASTATISAVNEGCRIEIDGAKKLAKALNKPVGELFQVIKEEKSYEKSSLAKRCRTLRAMLSMAKKQQYIEQNYARSEYIDTIRDEKKEKKFLDDKQAKQLIEGLKNYRDIRIKTALMTLLFTGIRRGELSGLEWGDIDLEEQTISIRRSCCQVTGMGIVTGDTKTQSSRRTIAIPQALVQILREYKEWWMEYTKSLGDRYDGIQRLFIQADSRQLYPSTIAYWLAKTLDELGIEQVNVHSLRHTNISLQIAAGVPLKT